MRSFWGLVLLVIGLIFLAINFGWVSAEIWNRIWQLWPLLLVAIGLRSLVKNDTAFTLILLALVLVAAATVRFLPNRELHLGMRHVTTNVNRSWHWGESRLSGEKATFTQGLQPEQTIDTVTLNLGGHYDISVVGGESNTISADLNGPKEFIENLAFSNDGSSVELRDVDDDMNIGWLFNDDEKVTGTVTVPKAALVKLKLSGVSTIHVKSTTGKLSVDASGASQVIAEQSAAIDPEIDLSGAGKVMLDQCSGTGRIDLSGAGKIELKNCSLKMLTVKASGAGTVDVQGSLKDLAADVSGAAKVKVPKVTGTASQDVSGVGKLEYY